MSHRDVELYNTPVGLAEGCASRPGLSAAEPAGAADNSFAEWSEVIYRELRRLAAYYLSSERPDHTLQPTALVHETWIRISSGLQPNWENRAHFFACAAHIMRNILVDYARHHLAAKRTGNAGRPAFLNSCEFSPSRLEELLAIDSALNRLTCFDPRLSRIVELKFFAGLSDIEIAGLLNTSTRTVGREWNLAKAWLQSRLS